MSPPMLRDSQEKCIRARKIYLKFLVFKFYQRSLVLSVVQGLEKTPSLVKSGQLVSQDMRRTVTHIEHTHLESAFSQ